MRKFISLPFKVILSLVISLAIMLFALAWFSIEQIEDNFRFEQYKKVQIGKYQYELHTQLVETQLRVVVEVLADSSNLASAKSFDPLLESLTNHLDVLQLYFDIDEVWFFDSKASLIYASGEGGIREGMLSLVQKTYLSQEPETDLFCKEQCQELITVPVMNNYGEPGVLLLSTNLVNIFFNMKMALKSELSMTQIEVDENGNVTSLDFVALSSAEIKAFIEKGLKPGVKLSSIIENGLQVDYNQQSKLVNVLPVSQVSAQNYYIVIVEDLYELQRKVESYRQNLVIGSLCVFVVLSLLIYVVTRSSSQRLNTLRHALPLIAEKSFDKFRKNFRHSRSYFPDEIDILNDSFDAMVTELKLLHEQIEQSTQDLEYLALYDPLTRLPNRNKFNQELRALLKQDVNINVAVLFMDLDDFKRINDIHGHNSGDKLLNTVANRIQERLNEHDFVSRFSGDEFVFIIKYPAGEQQISEFAESLLAIYHDPIHIDSDIYYISASIGVAFNYQQQSSEDLIRQADIATYEAKLAGGNCYRIYSASMYERVTRRVELEKEVRKALTEEQFYLCLQPQINIRNNKLIGFEALIRWIHPEKGFIPPDEFIPILENSEQMLELGYWIIRHSFEIAKSLMDKGLKDFHVAINLSADQFRDAALVPLLSSLLDEFEISASYIELELTESTLVTDIEETLQVMNSVKSLGFNFAIDDFGTGYSSLSYLKQMPVDIIKIDRSFISGITENETDYQIVMSTIAMVKNLKLKVVAEGVENSEELAILRDNECDYVQGYFFSKPISEHELISTLDKHLVEGLWQR